MDKDEDTLEKSFTSAPDVSGNRSLTVAAPIGAARVSKRVRVPWVCPFFIGFGGRRLMPTKARPPRD